MKISSFQLLIILLSLCLGLIGCGKTEIKNADSKGKNIICFGDSLTFGYGVDKGLDYPSLLAKMTPIPVINAGVDGDSSGEGLKRLGADVLDKAPRIVIIEFGGNDFLLNIPIQVTLNNISEMIDKVQAKGAMVVVVDVSAGILLGEYRHGLRRLAQQKKAVFVSGILEGIVTNPKLKSDFLHPNNKGYKIIARKIYLAIMPHLN